MLTTIQKPELEMRLAVLLQDFVEINSHSDRQILGLALDSRKVEPGFLFFAYPGDEADGRNYIDAAIQQGAIAIVYEVNGDSIPQVSEQEYNGQRIPLFAVAQLRHKVGFIAAKFYGNPAAKMHMIGITGTNGKTSCCQFLAQALADQHQLCGMLGTLGIGFPGKLLAQPNTTPEPITIQQQLADLRQHGAQAIAMEVTSQGLVQGRVNGIRFNIGVFTNLTRDHLDIHGSMENYAAAKRQLFTQPGLDAAVINVDDAYGRTLAKEFANSYPVYGYGLTDAYLEETVPGLAMVRGYDVKLTSRGFSLKVDTPWGQGELHSRLLGRFNVSNILAVLTVLGIMKIPLDQALASLANVGDVPGRMQAFGRGKQPLVIVDYAHTPDALKQALMAAREHCQGKLWCVFGCGGDRDSGKRPLMGEVAERYSDQLIITNDNPRHEDPEIIANAISGGLLCPWAAEILLDRETAIAHAIDCAVSGDVILIAGKGHETYQQTGSERFPFSDAEQVQKQLQTQVKMGQK